MATPSSDYSAIVEQIYTAMQEKGYNGTMADLALALSTLNDDNPATTKWIDLGASSAYAIYVEHGGTMSEAEWIEYLSTVSEKSAQAHADAQSAKESAEAAEQAKIDVTEEAEQAITDIQTEGQTQITDVTNKGTEQVGAVNTAGTTQVNAVNAAGTTQVTAVNTAGSTQVTAVQAQGTTSKDAVTAEGEKQVERVSNQGILEVQAVAGEGTNQTTALQTVATGLESDIRDVGQEVLDSIPEDYTDLQNNFVKVSDTQPETTTNKLWLKPSDEDIELAEMSDVRPIADDVADLESALNYDEEFLLQTGNLYDASTFTLGYLIMNDGSISENESYGYSDYIRVVRGQKYIMTRCLSTPGALYDLNKNYVEKIPNTSTVANFVFTPDIDGYIRINIGKNVYANFVVSEGEILKSEPSYGKTQLRNDTIVKYEQIDFGAEKPLTGMLGNLYSPDTASETGYYIDNRGNITPLTNHCYSDYIPVRAGQLYSFTVLLTSPGGFYNSEKTYISKINYVDNTFTPPLDGYIRVNIQIANKNSFIVSEGDALKQFPPAGRVAVENLIIRSSQIDDIQNVLSRWAGKRITTFGDSRTWYNGKTYGDTTKTEWRGQSCKGYQQQLIDLLGCEIDQQGVSGNTSKQICDRIRSYDFTNVDAVLLEGGVNDFVKSSQVTIGEIQPIGGPFDTDTVYGAWQSAIEYIMSNYPSVLIYVDIPAIAWTSDGEFPYSIAKIKGEIAELYNLPCLDLYKNGGISTVNRDYWYVDDVSQTNWRLHFNDYGNALIGAKLAMFINDN